MVKVGELKPDMTPPKILLMGEQGTGKTAFALTAGEHAIILDTDGGINSGLAMKDGWTQERHKVEYLGFRDADPQFPEVYRKFKAKLYELSGKFTRKELPYKVLICDSLTSIADHCRKYVQSNSGIKDFGSAPTQQHWLAIMNEMDNVTMVLSGLPIAVVLIAHVYDQEIDDAHKVRLACPGKKLPPNILRRFTELWYAKVRTSQGKTSFTLQTASTAAISVRSNGQLPDGFNMDLGLAKALETIGYPL